MNRDEIWEHQDGSHWRILAVDLRVIPNIAAECVKTCRNDFRAVGALNRLAPTDFTRQVRQPREFWLSRPNDARNDDRWVVSQSKPIPNMYEYMLVREVLE